MPVKYVELGLLYAPPGRVLFQELFQEAKGREIECGQFLSENPMPRSNGRRVRRRGKSCEFRGSMNDRND